MDYKKKIDFKCILVIILLLSVIFLIVKLEGVKGESVVPDEVKPGDFVALNGLHPFAEFIVGIFWQDYVTVHSAIYIEKFLGIDWFIESEFFGGVHPTPFWAIDWIWENIAYYEVLDDDQYREGALTEASQRCFQHGYQTDFQGTYVHFDTTDTPDESLENLPEYNTVKYECIPKYTCSELIWAAYMVSSNKIFNIGGEPPNPKPLWGDSCYDKATVSHLKSDSNTSPYNDLTFNPLYFDVIVDGNLANDNPDSNTWNTIQKGIDNMSSSQNLIIKNGSYNENIYVDKSIRIVGEDKENVTVSGSVTMNTPYDYELPNRGIYDIITNINMSENELLFHFNNDSSIGENYSSSNNIYDYSGNKRNGTKFNTIFTANNIKGPGALIFNGVNSSINVSTLTALSNENITISSWINWTEGTGEKDIILSQSNNTNGYCLYINCSTGKPVFRLDTDEATSSSNLTTGWYHIVGSHNETTLKIYIDGVMKGATTKTGSGSSFNTFIGYDNNSNYFNGTIDEISIWNRTLSDDEISRIFELNQGIILTNITIKDSEIGIKICNRTQLYNCNIINHTYGLYIDNFFSSWIMCNISECNTGIKIVNSTPNDITNIYFYGLNLSNCSNGIIVNSSSNISISYSYINCSEKGILFNDCNFSNISIKCFSPNNICPVDPILNGSSSGASGINYYYNSTTYDINNDQLFYMYDWGDGNITNWQGPYWSNGSLNLSHSWAEEGGYFIRVKAKDILGYESNWTTILFRTEELKPNINSVNHSSNLVGFGNNITITTNVTEDKSGNWSGIKNVYVNITYPNNNSINVSMTDIGNDTFQYNFTDTWTVGQYNYTIWALDNAYNTNSSTGHSFNITSQATISVCTIKDQYGDNESINLTDPPAEKPSIGYEFLDENQTLHIWNNHNSYYFNTSNGIQLTNHKDEYWTQNVLMLGYYNNNSWNLIYRTDELSGFTKNVTSDNNTYVNATLWKDLNYQGYDFRLAIRYHLGLNDPDLSVIPYIKNIDDEDIPYVLGFGWEMKDIKIANVTNDNYLRIFNGTGFEDILLNQTLNSSYTNMENNTTIQLVCKNPPTHHLSRNLYLAWDKNLTYKVTVKSRENQTNSPVTLFIRIGNLSINQEKSSLMHWLDSDDWLGISSSELDSHCGDSSGRTLSEALDGTDYWYHFGESDHHFIIDLGEPYTIKKLRGRSYRSCDPIDIDIFVSNNKSNWGNPIVSGISTWQDTASWQVVNLSTYGQGRYIKVQINDTEHLFNNIEWGSSMGPPYMTIFDIYGDNEPIVSNPYPTNGSNGIGISPTLNITICDLDGDTMNITWLSNSSGSWQIFGTNNSVSNGTYHQTFSNASVNGQWWYWKVNVTVDDGFTESSVYKFYTGYQSKIKNTGSTNIRGFLLIQIQYYNTTTTNWTLANDTINETTMRTINSSNQLGLDTIFNGLVNTSSLIDSFGYGSYRVYAAFRDPDGDVLICDDESLLEVTYQFTISTS